jgi:hypothetical protein
MKTLSLRMLRAARREDGTASVEFVLVFPLLLFVFMMAFESGTVMIRNMMLERSVDIVMRELRLNHYPNPDHDMIKEEICSNTVVFPDCETTLLVNLAPISMTTWDIPTEPMPCIDVAQEINPPPVWNASEEPHELMLVRACITVTAMFPTTGIGLRLPQDDEGRYWLTAVSAFVNEPST